MVLLTLINAAAETGINKIQDLSVYPRRSQILISMSKKKCVNFIPGSAGDRLTKKQPPRHMAHLLPAANNVRYHIPAHPNELCPEKKLR